MAKITGFLNKIDLLDKPTIDRQNKVVADDINEIKQVVNTNDDLLDTKTDKGGYEGTAKDLYNKILELNLSGNALLPAFSQIIDRGIQSGGTEFNWESAIKHKITLPDNGSPISLVPAFSNYENFEAIKTHTIVINSLRADNVVDFPSSINPQDLIDTMPIDFSTPNLYNYVDILYLGNNKFRISNYVKEII